MKASAQALLRWSDPKKGLFTFGLQILARGAGAADQLNLKDDFCRRYGHQTTVIDDKLYIDGGYVDYTSFSTTQKDYASEIIFPRFKCLGS
jgi:hypothetical protein